jgi:hypothetical protein
MKKKIEEIITIAAKIEASHNDMDISSIYKELDELRLRLIIAEEELIELEDTAFAASDLLDEAILSVNRVSDCLETHHGGSSIR